MFKRLSSLLIGAACLVSSAAQAQDRDVKFALDFISLGRHAPWYVALSSGALPTSAMFSPEDSS